MSSFGVKEGRFLGHMVTEEGLRADPGRIQAIILSPTPKSPNQIRSLFLQLKAISKFTPKLAELKHPIREARTRIETTKESGWTNETEEALRRIKRKLRKLQTLAILKEGEDLMLCLRQRNEIISSVLLVERKGIQIPVSYISRPLPKEKMYSYAIRLKFKASNHGMDCEALLAGLAASANQGMKELHVFIDSLTLVAQVEGNHTPATEQERRTGNYKARIPQPGSIGRYQNKTIDRRDKQQQERQSNKQSTKGKTKLQPRS
ncbi:reverse transcriptase domain-containing protein [Tanacetum coccineum]